MLIVHAIFLVGFHHQYTLSIFILKQRIFYRAAWSFCWYHRVVLWLVRNRGKVQLTLTLWLVLTHLSILAKLLLQVRAQTAPGLPPVVCRLWKSLELNEKGSLVTYFATDNAFDGDKVRVCHVSLIVSLDLI